MEDKPRVITKTWTLDAGTILVRNLNKTSDKFFYVLVSKGSGEWCIDRYIKATGKRVGGL